MFRFCVYLSILVLFAEDYVTEAIVPKHCLDCICQLESHCKPVGCHMDVGSLSCGYFQIKEAYWIDCGKPGKDWKSCANDFACASKCVQNYMKRYAKWCPQTCESFARQHNGGPNGCNNPNTLDYWRRLKALKGCGDLEDLKFEHYDLTANII